MTPCEVILITPFRSHGGVHGNKPPSYTGCFFYRFPEHGILIAQKACIGRYIPRRLYCSVETVNEMLYSVRTEWSLAHRGR